MIDAPATTSVAPRRLDYLPVGLFHSFAWLRIWMLIDQGLYIACDLGVAGAAGGAARSLCRTSGKSAGYRNREHQSE